MKKGRPLLLDREKANKIIGILQIPQSIETACDATGISETTFYRWQRAGKKAENVEKRGGSLSDDERAFCQFWQATKSARAIGKCVLLEVIQNVANDKANPKRWQAAAWMLERMYPQEFGRRYIRLDVGRDDGTGEGSAGGGAGEVIVNLTIEGDGKPPSGPLTLTDKPATPDPSK